MKPMLQTIRMQIENLRYPELHPYGRSDRDRLLQKSSETPFDFIEWIGILTALVLVVSLTRYSVADLGLENRAVAALVNFLAAILLLGVIGGPFLVRRKRRGLRAQLR